MLSLANRNTSLTVSSRVLVREDLRGVGDLGLDSSHAGGKPAGPS
jgi:hypothetical protein